MSLMHWNGRGRSAASAAARARWEAAIDGRAYVRLRELRSRALWDGTPPVPVDHVIEHLLELDICYLPFAEGANALGGLDAPGREVVLNERMADVFRNVPGVLAFTKAHEAGHADLYGLAGAHAQHGLGGDAQAWAGRYAPERVIAYRSRAGETDAVEVSVFASEAFRRLSRARKTALYEVMHEEERARHAAGEDTGLERRTVDRYASVLLMPEDLVRAYVRDKRLDVTRPADLHRAADAFGVSRVAMRHRAVELGLAYEGRDGALTRVSPAEAGGQGSLF